MTENEYKIVKLEYHVEFEKKRQDMLKDAYERWKNSGELPQKKKARLESIQRKIDVSIATQQQYEKEIEKMIEEEKERK